MDGMTLMVERMVRMVVAGLAVSLLVSGCVSVSPSAARQAQVQAIPQMGLMSPMGVPSVEAVCVPPIGWRAEPLKQSEKHTHQVWLSPTGETAYGVIHFQLPLPVGSDLALTGYLRAMKKSEGEAVLLSRQDDPELPGIRFVAEGGLYQTRNNLIVAGWEGWAVYAGTLRDRPINPVELELAERAREHTQVGVR